MPQPSVSQSIYLPATTGRARSTGQRGVLGSHQQAKLKGACPHYRSSQKVQYAKGCMNILDNLPHKQRQLAIIHLMEYFSRRTYYRIRKGERLLSPAEQRDVQKILKQCGATGKQEFDAYVEDYEW